MMKRRLWQLLLFTVMITGCAGGPESSEDRAISGLTNEMTQPEVVTSDMQVQRDQANGLDEEEAATSTHQESNESAIDEVNPEERKVIYRAHVSMEVKNFQNTRQQIETIVNQFGGYIVQTSQYEGEQEIGGHLSARIPEDKFSTFLDDVETLADKLPQREVTGSDVTEEYVDLESRLKAKQAVEKRLLAFMEDAQKTEDLLKISKDLSDVQEDIEQLTGRIKYINNQAAYATVDIDIIQPLVNRGVAGESERNTLAAAWHALIASTNGLLNFFSRLVVFLAGALPVLIILAVIAVPFLIWWRKKGRHIIATRRGSDDSSD